MNYTPGLYCLYYNYTIIEINSTDPCFLKRLGKTLMIPRDDHIICNIHFTCHFENMQVFTYLEEAQAFCKRIEAILKKNEHKLSGKIKVGRIQIEEVK